MRWFNRSFSLGRRSTGTVRPPATEMDCTSSASDLLTCRILAKGLDVLPDRKVNRASKEGVEELISRVDSLPANLLHRRGGETNLLIRDRRYCAGELSDTR